MRKRLAAAALTAWVIIIPLVPAAEEAPPPAPAAGDYLARLEAYNEAVATLRGTAAFKAYGAMEGNFNAAFAYVRPDRGRLEISTPLGGTALVITARGDEMLLYYPLDDVAVVAPGAEWAFAGMPVGTGGFYQLLNWLAARPRLYGAEVRAGAVTLAAEPAGDGNVALTWRRTSDGARLQMVTVAAEPFRLLSARLFEGEAAVFDATYDDWRARGEATMPYAITLRAEETLVEIAVKKLETNAPVDDGAFSTVPPEGAAVMETWPPAAELDAE
jgi:outer membrane lipoprotein-sorting protein